MGFKPLRLGAVFLCRKRRMKREARPSFKPLRLGAVFLWPRRRTMVRRRLPRFKPLRLGAVFLCHGRLRPAVRAARFKPLRLGAVFLCAWLPAEHRSGSSWFQTPAPRGGVPLRSAHHRGHPGRRVVSNPCASGRCSSGWWFASCSAARVSFKPLRLGAVFLCWAKGSARSRSCEFQTPAPRGGVPLPSATS